MLLDEDNYRQDQMKIKGILNIISGVQLYLFSYNPLLVAALGLTGGGAVLGGASFALSTGIDLITASIDFYNAYKERGVQGWLEEKQKEYAFLNKRIDELEAENLLLADADLLDFSIFGSLQKNIFRENQKKLEELGERRDQLKKDIIVRCRVNGLLSLELEQSLNNLGIELPQTPLTDLEQEIEHRIQTEMETNFENARDTLIIKVASFVGMSLLAAGTIALFVTCPPAVPVVGFAITIIVASWYLYRHGHEILNKIDSLLNPADKANQKESADIDALKADKEMENRTDNEIMACIM